MRVARWHRLAVIGGLLGTIYFLVPWLIVQAALAATLGLFATVALFARGSGPWRWLSVGVAAFVIGDVIFAGYEVTYEFVPFPNWSDALYLAAYPILTIGLLGLVRQRSAGQHLGNLLDTLIVSVALGVVYWMLVVEPSLQGQDFTRFQLLVSCAYPLSDLVLLTATMRLVAVSELKRSADLLLIIGVGAMLVADVLFGLEQVTGSLYQTGTLMDGGWLIFYFTWGLAAIHPSSRRCERIKADPRLTQRRLVILSTVALIPPVVFLVQQSRGAGSDPNLVIAGSTIVALLVLARVGNLAFVLEKALEAQAQGEADFRRAFATNPVPMWILQQSTHRFLQVNDAAVAHYGYERDRFLSMTAADLLPEEDVVRATMSSDATSLHVHEGVTRHRLRNGGTILVEIIAHDTHFQGEPAILEVVQDVTERRRLASELAQRAFHDPLTGLPNRSLLLERLNTRLTSLDVDPRESRSAALLFLDIDDFKLVNDSLGHGIGDELLVAIATRLDVIRGPGVTVSRFGGDEFVVLMERVVDHHTVGDAVDAIADVFRRPFTLAGRPIQVSASVGVVSPLPNDQTAEDHLRAADAAMYLAKQRGTGNVVANASHTQGRPWGLAEEAIHPPSVLKGSADSR